MELSLGGNSNEYLQDTFWCKNDLKTAFICSFDDSDNLIAYHSYNPIKGQIRCHLMSRGRPPVKFQVPMYVLLFIEENLDAVNHTHNLFFVHLLYS